jgi:hypothetical protein
MYTYEGKGKTCDEIHMELIECPLTYEIVHALKIRN